MKMAASVMSMLEAPAARPSHLRWLALRLLMAAACFPAGAGAGAADGAPRLGRQISPADAATAGVTIFADGRGLPAGSGDARIGKQLFAQHCARCHGAGGRGGSAPELVGGTAPLNSARPDRTIGLLWPYAPALFDFNWRAMPMDKPGMLTADDAYAVTAYLLFAEGLIGESAVMNRQTLPTVPMPNRAGFDWIDVRAPAAR